MFTREGPREQIIPSTWPAGHRLVSKFPRVRLNTLRTPLEPMERLSRQVTGPRLYIKRDDCTSLAMGGNKVRQLEFIIGDATAKGADTLISSAAVQSNYLRVLAAAATKLGLACEIVREDRVREIPDDYYTSGNVFLQDLYGAKSQLQKGTDDDEYADRFLHKISARVSNEGGKPYVIGAGMDNPALGALGYVEATAEMLEQFAEQDLDVDAIVLPSGSGQTHAGILVGLRALQSKIHVYGICVRRNAIDQTERVSKRAREVAALIGTPNIVSEEDVWVTDAYLGPSYGIPSNETIATIKLSACTEGLLLDPVYSGKAMTGLLGLVRSGQIGPHSAVVFLHTGGTPALFAYRSRILGYGNAQD
jgi:L-cysteate sulfo-lyase